MGVSLLRGARRRSRRSGRLLNGGFEVDTTGWQLRTDAAITLTRITTDRKYGAACMEVVCPNPTSGVGVRSNVANGGALTAGETKTWAVWLKSVSGTTSLQLLVTDQAFGGAVGAAITITPTWARYVLSFVVPTTDIYLFYVVTAAAATATFRMDGAQVL